MSEKKGKSAKETESKARPSRRKTMVRTAEEGAEFLSRADTSRAAASQMTTDTQKMLSMDVLELIRERGKPFQRPSESEEPEEESGLEDILRESPSAAAMTVHIPEEMRESTEEEIEQAQQALIAPTKQDANRLKTIPDVIKALEDEFPIIHLRAQAGDPSFPIKFIVELLKISEDGRKVYATDIGEFGKSLDEFITSGGVNGEELHAQARKVLRSYQSKVASRRKLPRAKMVSRKTIMKSIRKLKVEKPKKKKRSAQELLRAVRV